MERLEPGEEERIRKLLPRVRDPKIREAAESLLDGRAQIIPIIGPLLDVLKSERSSDWTDRMTATWALGHAKLTPDQREAAAAMLGWGLRPYKQGAAALMPLPWEFTGLQALTLCSVIAAIGFVAVEWVLTAMVSPFFWITFVVLGAAFVHSAVLGERHLALHIEFARALGNIATPDGIAALSRAYIQSSRWKRIGDFTKLYEASRSGLLRTLDAPVGGTGSITFDTSLGLELLVGTDDSAVVLSALKALRTIGMPRSIPAIQALIRKRPSPGIRSSAGQTLGVLEARKRETDESVRLLRASELEPSAESLLRPARGGVEAEEPLLRPVESGGVA